MNSKSKEVSKSASPKRNDLQGIRGFAIISVIAFHFYPATFPNGYLGVDQFFVLSGFLMGMLLKRSQNMPKHLIISIFYVRRLKRIIPLYILVITITLIALYSVYPDTAIETNQKSASMALLFISNRPKTMTEDYFQMLSLAVDLFTHTWSLSVEVQFYAIIPFLFILGSKLTDRLQIFYYLTLSCLSFLLYSFSSPSVAFNSVYSRVWQFNIGIIVYLLTNMNSHQNYQQLPKCKSQSIEDQTLGSEDLKKGKIVIMNNSEKYFILARVMGLILMLFIILYPKLLPSGFCRTVVTLTTGSVMLISKCDAILSNRLLVYIGDISYSLYMIHWPIYAYYKLKFNDNEQYLSAFLILSIFVAIIVHEIFEKWYLKLSTFSLAIFVTIFYTSSVVLINRDIFFAPSFSSDGNITLDVAEKLNYEWGIHDDNNIMSPTCLYEKSGPLGFCTHTGFNKTAKYKIMIFGNSWTANHAKMLNEECHQKINSMIQDSAYACEPFYAVDLGNYCSDYLKQFEKKLEEFKPDIAFTFTRFIRLGNSTGFSGDLENDEVFNQMKVKLDTYLKHIGQKLYILDALPGINSKNINSIVQQIRSGARLEDIDNMVVNMTDYQLARNRYSRLFEYCGEKCVQIDYEPEFYNQTRGTFRYFGTNGLTYFTNSNHLSPHGIEHIRHIYTDICRNL